MCVRVCVCVCVCVCVQVADDVPTGEADGQGMAGLCAVCGHVLHHHLQVHLLRTLHVFIHTNRPPHQVHPYCCHLSKGTEPTST